MAPPKRTFETPKKNEPLVIIPDTVADLTPTPSAPEDVPALLAAPDEAIKQGMAQVETTIDTVVETTGAIAAETVAKAGLSTVAKNIHNTQTEIKTNMDKAIKTAEEFVTFSKGNIEAMMKSSQIWIAGLQDLSKSFAATAQAQMEETVSTMKTFAGLRSFKDAVDLQTSFARTSFEKAMSETGKITESSMKLAEQALAPITARVTVAVEKFGRAV